MIPDPGLAHTIGDREFAREAEQTVSYRQSMEIRRKIGDAKGTADSLGQLGMLHQQQGRYDEAGEHYRQVMEIANRIGSLSMA